MEGLEKLSSMVSRLDERTSLIIGKLTELNAGRMDDKAAIKQDLKELKALIDNLDKDLTKQTSDKVYWLKEEVDAKFASKTAFENVETTFVNQSEFEPIKKAVYGLISVILLVVITSVISFTLKQNQ